MDRLCCAHDDRRGPNGESTGQPSEIFKTTLGKQCEKLCDADGNHCGQEMPNKEVTGLGKRRFNSVIFEYGRGPLNNAIGMVRWSRKTLKSGWPSIHVWRKPYKRADNDWWCMALYACT